jgi:hypothetical protein
VQDHDGWLTMQGNATLAWAWFGPPVVALRLWPVNVGVGIQSQAISVAKMGLEGS